MYVYKNVADDDNVAVVVAVAPWDVLKFYDEDDEEEATEAVELAADEHESDVLEAVVTVVDFSCRYFHLFDVVAIVVVVVVVGDDKMKAPFAVWGDMCRRMACC